MTIDEGGDNDVEVDEDDIDNDEDGDQDQDVTKCVSESRQRQLWPKNALKAFSMVIAFVFFPSPGLISIVFVGPKVLSLQCTDNDTCC